MNYLIIFENNGENISDTSNESNIQSSNEIDNSFNDEYITILENIYVVNLTILFTLMIFLVVSIIKGLFNVN